jgi:hypothetical protein
MKSNEISQEWVDYIIQCHRSGCDIESTREKLYEVFNEIISDRWIDHVWFNGPIPTIDYNFEFSWIPDDLSTVNGVEIEYIHKEPTIALFHNILSEKECDDLVNHYKKNQQIRDAQVYDDTTGESKNSDVRTNKLIGVDYGTNSIITKLEKRISDITRLDVRHGESIQLLFYSVGEKYTPHDDFFRSSKGSSRTTQYGQRIASIVTYLNDVEEGGETNFPFLDIMVKPKKGMSIYFEYTDDKANTTTQCRHESLPVISGEKWVATKWLRQYFIMPEIKYQNFYT